MVILKQKNKKTSISNLGGEGDPLGIVQEVKIWPYEQMVYAQPRICSGKVLWDIEIQTNHIIAIRRPDLVIVKKKKNEKKRRNCWIVSFVILAEHRVKLKKGEKRDKYLELAGELKKNKLWSLNVMMKPIVIGMLGTETKGLIMGLEDMKIRGRVVTFQTPALLRSTRILRRNLETWGDLLLFWLQWKTIS